MLSAASLKVGQRVLDAGCGTGALGVAAAERGGRVLAVDFSDEMVRLAATKASSLGIKDYIAKAAEISALTLDENSFDAILAGHVVGLLPTMKVGIKKLGEVLAPRGRLVISEWGPLGRNPWMAVAVDAIREAAQCQLFREDEPGPFRCSEPKRLATLFKDAGVYNEYAIREVSGEIRFDSPSHYWRFVSEATEPVASTLEGPLAERRSEIKRAVLAAVKPYLRGRRPVFQWSAWVASGIKPRRHAKPPMRLHVVYEDQHGRVWHEHDSVYPEPKDAKPPFKSFAEILPPGYKIGFDP